MGVPGWDRMWGWNDWGQNKWAKQIQGMIRRVSASERTQSRGNLMRCAAHPACAPRACPDGVFAKNVNGEASFVG